MNKKIYLPLLIAVLVVFTIWVSYGRAPKNNPVTQKWEYKRISVFADPSDMTTYTQWTEFDGAQTKQLPTPVSTPIKTNELGEQGWELISVTPISNYLRLGYTSTVLLGATSRIDYWFKRAKQ